MGETRRLGTEVGGIKLIDGSSLGVQLGLPLAVSSELGQLLGRTLKLGASLAAIEGTELCDGLRL